MIDANTELSVGSGPAVPVAVRAVTCAPVCCPVPFQESTGGATNGATRYNHHLGDAFAPFEGSSAVSTA